jgi:hypothetical protein
MRGFLLLSSLRAGLLAAQQQLRNLFGGVKSLIFNSSCHAKQNQQWDLLVAAVDLLVNNW